MGIGPGSIIIIGIVALLIFGPKKLPELGKAFGSTLREFKNATSGLVDDDDKEKKKTVETVETVEMKEKEASK